MSFIEGYERQLVDAAERHYKRRPRRFVSRHRRGLAVAIAALAVAGPAATAAVTAWDPFDDPGRSPRIGRPTVSQNTTVPALTERLGVLRRPQTDADRGAITVKRVRGLGGSFRGVQLRGIRLLQPDRGVVLVPFEEQSVPRDPEGRPLPEFADARYRNVACVVEPSSDGTDAIGCHNARAIDSGRAIGSGAGEVSGLVPDGVARVRLIRGEKTTAEASVRDNYFHAAGPHPNVVEWLAPGGALLKRIELG